MVVTLISGEQIQNIWSNSHFQNEITAIGIESKMYIFKMRHSPDLISSDHTGRQM